MAYGTIARCKSDWLNISDSGSDTQLTGLLETSNRKMDNMLNPYVVVPLTGSDITDFINRVAEQWTAGLYLMSAGKGKDEFDKGKELEQMAVKDLKMYTDTLIEPGLVTSVGTYETEPMASG